jgi:cobalt transporter subunit CbtA
VSQFRKLTLVALVCGTLAGLVQFAVQHFTVVPVIQAAEVYERGAALSHGESHEDEGWQPAEGWERTSFTVIASVLNGIASAAILFGLASLTGKRLNIWSGVLWGLAAFVCFGVAPALGLPPQPPGAPTADLYHRQFWWVSTVIATAAGIWLLADKKRSWMLRGVGVFCLVVPHIIGAPVATGPNVVPLQLMHQFATLSLATTGLFWLLLGFAGGAMYQRMEARTNSPL